MKITLTKREKILLFSAVLLVFVYLAFQFGFLPLYERYSEAQSVHERLSEVRATGDRNIANRNAIIEANNNAHIRLEGLLRDYPLLVPNEEVDTTLTHLCLRNMLRPSMLRITRPPPHEPGSQSGPNGDDAQNNEPPVFTVITAAMNVSGTYASLMNLFDEVDTMPYIRITNVSYSESRDESDDASISLTFELTYINP